MDKYLVKRYTAQFNESEIKDIEQLCCVGCSSACEIVKEFSAIDDARELILSDAYHPSCRYNSDTNVYVVTEYIIERCILDEHGNIVEEYLLFPIIGYEWNEKTNNIDIENINS